MGESLHLEVRPDWVGILWLDDPGAKVNKLSFSVLEELDQVLDHVATDQKVKALVLASPKRDVFLAGADIEEIREIRSEQVAYDAARRGQRVLEKLSALLLPTVAAIDGACLGGGLELALACTYRLASDNPKTSLGLPEVKLGIIPGFGGTQRLPRIVGLKEALQLILNGTSVDGREALKLGLVSACVPRHLLLGEAVKLALAAAGGKKPRRRRRGPGAWVLEKTPTGRKMVFQRALDAVIKATRGHYPAPLTALDVMRETATLPLDKGLEIEAGRVAPLVVSDASKNLIHLHFLAEEVKKARGTEKEVEARPVGRLGVIGAGTMGAGLAQLAAARGLSVRLKDIQEPFLGRGMAEAHGLSRGTSKGESGAREAHRVMARLSPTLTYEGFSTLDAVIETAVEKLAVKRQILMEVEAAAGGRLLFATCTDSLSVTEIAQEARSPERVVGMHFFSPPQQVRLVEVVRGRQSGERAMAEAFGLARVLGKIPVACKDGPGFLVNRLLTPYMNEAAYLLLEGVPVEDVDGAMGAFGMSRGPVSLMDEMGLDVVARLGAALEAHGGERAKAAPIIGTLCRGSFLGKRRGAGFYLYGPDGQENGPNPEAANLLPPPRSHLPDGVLQERMILPMINEASLLLEEGIVRRAGEVDLAMVMGAGFPPFRGGLLRFADTLGLPRVADRLKALALEVGPRYQPSHAVLSLARRNGIFYQGEG